MARKPPAIPLRGRPAEPLLMEITRELTFSDLERLAEAPKVGVPIIQKLRSVHHRQAQLLADGMKLVEVAAIVGCTPQRLTQLQQDPAFAELIHFYRDQKIRAHLEDTARIKAKLIDVAEMSIDEITARLEDQERLKKIPMSELRKIVELGADRTVAPPAQAAPPTAAPPQITINFGTALRPVHEEDRSPVIEGERSVDTPAAITVDLATSEPGPEADDEF